MPPRTTRLVSKFYRLRISRELRTMLTALPIRKMRETQVGNHVYLANGELRVGNDFYPAKIRVWIEKGRVLAAVRAPKAGVHIQGWFDPLAIPRAVNQALRSAAC